MPGKRTRTFQDNIKEHIRRSINNPEIRGTEKLKWCLAGIKLLQMEKFGGTTEHGTGFATIDKDEPDDADALLEETDPTPDEEGASHGHAPGNGHRANGRAAP
jgi:hypothetical protein